MSSADQVTVRLSQDQALVLFELLSRFSDKNDLAIEDQAEARALWDLCCALEKELVQPFSPNYGDVLRKARAAIRETDEPGPSAQPARPTDD